MNKAKTLLIFVFLFTNIGTIEARDVYVKLSGASSYSIGTTAGSIAMTDADGRRQCEYFSVRRSC